MSSHQQAIERQVLAAALLQCGPWRCTHDDQALQDHARAQARAVAHDAAYLGDGDRALSAAIDRAERHQIEAPDPEEYGPRGALGRLSCEMWWRRQLRRLNARRLEQRERVLGRVHDRAGIYVSNQGYRARREQQVRNARMLEAVTATKQEGQSYTLAELAEIGLSNPEHRRAELMLRIGDTEREADRLGHVGMFYTLTCPSRFHAVWKGTARQNPKWLAADCPTPREAQAHLQGLWAKARASLSRAGLGIYGIRVVEPHHDGCPHWHMLLWCEPDDEPAITATLRAYALGDSPEEVARRPSDSDARAVKREHTRFKPVRIDPERGSAAGYVAKYIAKNINGEQPLRGEVEGDHLDHYGHDLRVSAPRIESWASTWGIRQFQFVGLPSVTVWRELRRIREESAIETWQEERNPEPEAAAILADLRRAADAGKWAEFMDLMGGPMRRRDERPAAPWRITRRALGGALQTGAYGDPLETTLGVVVTSALGEPAECLTRFYRWTTERTGAGGGFEFERLAEGQSPWTGVNNCTHTPKSSDRSPLNEWEWHITEAYRRMKPAPSPALVEKIRVVVAGDAESYRIESAKRLDAAQRERERVETIRDTEDAIIQWLAAGEITIQQAAEVLTA